MSVESGLTKAECPICLRDFRPLDPCSTEPKVLSCGHSICEGCLSTMTKASYLRYVDCPICRRQTRLPRIGPLPTNYALMEAMRDLKLRTPDQSSASSTSTDSDSVKQPTCGSCPNEMEWETAWTCETCKEALLCPSCALKEHRSHKLTETLDAAKTKKKELLVWKSSVGGSLLALLKGQELLHDRMVRLLAEAPAEANHEASAVSSISEIITWFSQKLDRFEEDFEKLGEKESTVELLKYNKEDIADNTTKELERLLKHQTKILATVSSMNRLYREINDSVKQLKGKLAKDAQFRREVQAHPERNSVVGETGDE